ncbi:MAG: hypothetical protein PV344_08420, partial [Anaplasma sp.]|nr:hypothetical protein [Anaplasma sp.]
YIEHYLMQRNTPNIFFFLVLLGGSVAEWASAFQLGTRGAKARAAEPRDPGFNPHSCPIRSE